MEIAHSLHTTQAVRRFAMALCAILFGISLITLASLVTVPFYPVPFTLQTLAIGVLGLTQNPRCACGSALGYLTAATFGLPVFAGIGDPFWILDPTAGYLLSFPAGTYVIARISERTSSFVAVGVGSMLILLGGFVWLVPFVGWQEAFVKGVLLFVFPGIIKGLIAMGIASLWKKGLKQWK